MPHILIVEDDVMNRDILARRLAWEGYQVSTALNGAQAVDLASRCQPDLILMDVGLPVLNGWQATRAIKSQPGTSHIPIIILTAYALQDERYASLEAGCDDYETKPIDFTRLFGKMQQYMNRMAGSSPLLNA